MNDNNNIEQDAVTRQALPTLGGAGGGLILKETRHILRDRRTMLILFGMPVVMMLLFGFAISTDVKNVRLAVVTPTIDNQSRKIIDRLDASEYFTVTQLVGTTDEARQLLSDSRADMAIVFTPRFANHAYDGTAGIQIISDYTDPNTAEMQTAYAQQIIAGDTVQPTLSRLLYNPQMKSAYNFVPGIMGMLLMLICAMMTSVSIVKEKERGTMEVLLVSPVRPIYIIIAKAIPYMVLSLLILACVLLISRFILGVPIAGNLMTIIGVSLLYILLALSLGLLISVVAQTQVAALLMSGMMLLLPSIMLSGMIYPIESMPLILQCVADVVPARWYITAIRKLMIMGVDFSMIRQEFVILTVMTVILLTIALKKFKTRLE